LIKTIFIIILAGCQVQSKNNRKESSLEKLIITAALCGSAPMKSQNPNVPYTPAEIAAEAVRSREAGAAVVHIHVRDPNTGAPAFEKALFAETVERIRDKCKVLINLTTSGFNITGPDVGEARLMPLSLKPDLCSLDVGSLNFRGGRIFQNPPEWVEKAATAMKSAGVKPEMEVFDMGHIRQARDLVERGLTGPPPYFQLCLGIPWGVEGTLESLMEMRKRLPAGAAWSALATGPLQLSLTTHALLMGGHVRVGFEDNLYLRRGEKAGSNADFVERTAALARLLDREVAEPEDARRILGLAS
jgi:3-keto-5-aminohexanoate cleavage enzyme